MGAAGRAPPGWERGTNLPWLEEGKCFWSLFPGGFKGLASPLLPAGLMQHWLAPGHGWCRFPCPRADLPVGGHPRAGVSDAFRPGSLLAWPRCNVCRLHGIGELPANCTEPVHSSSPQETSPTAQGSISICHERTADSAQPGARPVRPTLQPSRIEGRQSTGSQGQEGGGRFQEPGSLCAAEERRPLADVAELAQLAFGTLCHKLSFRPGTQLDADSFMENRNIQLHKITQRKAPVSGREPGSSR